MTTFQPRDPAYDERVRASFARQGLLRTLSASLVDVTPGRVEIALPPVAAISQQHGFVHAGALATIADSAAGDRIVARGRVIRAGRTLTLSQTEVFSDTAGKEKLVAFLTGTFMTIEGREGIND